jgi:hypothetical protein
MREESAAMPIISGASFQPAVVTVPNMVAPGQKVVPVEPAREVTAAKAAERMTADPAKRRQAADEVERDARHSSDRDAEEQEEPEDEQPDPHGRDRGANLDVEA